MNLVLDIGNTRTKAGLFSVRLLKEKAIWDAWTLEDLSDFVKKNRVEKVIASSVAQPIPDIRSVLPSGTQYIEMNSDTPLPFRNQYKTPHTLGKDRLAAIAGARLLFPRMNALVVDCGTCIKYDFVSGEGVYLGGNIAPGAAMRLKAMHHFTARLPEAEFRLPADIIGDSTETALQNGALLGAALEIQGFADLFKRRYRHVRVLLTGGDSAFFVKLLKIRALYHDPDLVLKGLNHILSYNAQAR